MGLLILSLASVGQAAELGDFDTSFSGDGKLTTDFGGSDGATALVMQPTDGRLVVAGGGFGVSTDFVLARYHAVGCGSVAATRIGTPGNDILNGTAGRDVIQGFGGRDTISGFGGNDVLCGESGNDTLNGGDGNNTLFGNPGDDALTGGPGRIPVMAARMSLVIPPRAVKL